MNKVSEIILIYNVEAFIEKCVRSLMEQTFEDIEYIFINDCSPDKSMQILSGLLLDYPNRMPHVKIINHDNKGVSAARNAALDIAKAEWITFIDSHDYVEPGFLENVSDAECDLMIKQYRKDSLHHKVVEQDI
jgi:glycosyltransferase involved in cell wall biosynthesis